MRHAVGRYGFLDLSERCTKHFLTVIQPTLIGKIYVPWLLSGAVMCLCVRTLFSLPCVCVFVSKKKKKKKVSIEQMYFVII